MRPLFKKKAEELRRVDVKKIPKLNVGGALAIGRGLYGLAKNAVVPAYRYLAPKVSQYITQPTTKFMARPGAQTTLAGLEGYSIGEGAGQMYEGATTGDVGKVLTGAALAIPGAAFLPGTAKRSGIKALQESGEYLAPRMGSAFKTLAKNPGKTTIGALGAGGLGMFMSPSEAQSNVPPQMTPEEYRQSVEDRLIYERPSEAESLMEMKERATDTAKLSEAEAFMRGMKEQGGKKVVGLKNPVGAYEIGINKGLVDSNKLIDVAKQLGIDLKDLEKGNITDKEAKNLAIESNVDIKDVYKLTGKKAPEITPPPTSTSAKINKVTNNINGMTNEEVNQMVVRRKQNIEEGKNLSSVSKEFASFRDGLNEITGGNNNLNNLVLMKVAGQLLSGKTTQKGFSGFLDVAGQGLQVAGNDLANIAIAQKKQDMELAQAFLKAKADAAKAAAKGAGVVAGDKTYRIESDKYPGGFYMSKGLVGKDGKQLIRDENNNIIEAPPGQVGYQTSEDQKTMRIAANNLEDVKRAQQMVGTVIDILPENGTFTAAFGLFKEDLYGTGEQVFGRSGVRYLTSDSFDSQIRKLISNNDNEEDREKALATYEKDMSKVGDRAKEMYKEARKDLGGGFFSQPTDEQLNKFTQLALIEQRMKYLVANANKAQDRLTQKDIENAAQRTEIIKFFGSARTVRKNYQNLRKEFNELAKSNAMQYRRAGGTEKSMQYFRAEVPGVEELYTQRQQDYLQKQKAKNVKKRNQTLTTLPGVN